MLCADGQHRTGGSSCEIFVVTRQVLTHPARITPYGIKFFNVFDHEMKNFQAGLNGLINVKSSFALKEKEAVEIK